MKNKHLFKVVLIPALFLSFTLEILAQNELESSSKFMKESQVLEEAKELILEEVKRTRVETIGFDHINRSTVVSNATDSLIRHFKAKRFGPAFKDLEIIIPKNQNLGILYYLRGTVSNYLLRFNDAITSINQALQLRYTSADCYFEKGFAHLSLNQLPEAIASYDQGFEKNPKVSFRYFERGKAYYQLAKLPKALEDFNFLLTSTKPEPTYFAAYRGATQLKLGMYEEAAKSYSRVVSYLPNDGEGYFQLGMANYGLYEYAKAIDNFNDAKRLNYPIDASYFKGMSFTFLQYYDSASKYLARSPEGFYREMLSASLAVMKGEYSAALQNAEKAVAIFESPESLNLRGFVLFKMGKYKQCVEEYDKAVKKGGARFNPRFDYREEAAAKL